MIGYNLQNYIWVWMCVKIGVQYSPNCYFNGETDDKALELIEGQCFFTGSGAQRGFLFENKPPHVGVRVPNLGRSHSDITRCIIHEASMCRSV